VDIEVDLDSLKSRLKSGEIVITNGKINKSQSEVAA